MGNLYGTTAEGGAFDHGTVFKIDSSGQVTVLYSFAPIDGIPASGVILDRAGNLYGTAQGQASEGSTVYRIDPSEQETVLHTFSGLDGTQPSGELIRDEAGNLYGTMSSGGAADSGTVYKIDASGHETVIHSFSGPDGNFPSAGVIRDGTGNLYGTTSGGGAYGYGTVFRIDPSGQETVLYSFASVEGSYPTGELIRDGAGNFYGTTQDNIQALIGQSKYGTVFKIDTSGQEAVLHRFKSEDGYYPNAGVIRDGAGNLFGTTGNGGLGGQGTVYEIDASGQEALLHSFKGPDGAYPVNGIEFPYAGVVHDQAGNLYGTTAEGGASGSGTVFKIDPRGELTVLHSFGGSDGASPYGGVVRDGAGNLYGTTAYGGASGSGVVFKIDPAGQETLLYSFSAGRDGITPYAGVIVDSEGALYGTTCYGGAFGFGTVFMIDRSGRETLLHSFRGTLDGSYPQTGVIRDAAGNLYGTTNSNGRVLFAGGTVYKLEPSGQVTVLSSFQSPEEFLYYPSAGVVRDKAGNLYGVTTNSGAFYEGSVYKLDSAGQLTVLYSFQGGEDGSFPVAVTLDESGNLIGTTLYGGTKLGGTVFQLKLNPYSN